MVPTERSYHRELIKLDVDMSLSEFKKKTERIPLAFKEKLAEIKQSKHPTIDI